MTIKISILIPVFNRSSFIGECIESAINQNYKDIEIIVVDNASDDGTWDICQEYVKKDSRVKIFRNQKNIGPVLNWMRCIKEAKGEYGKILFSDDLILPDFLDYTVPHLFDPNIAFVSTAAYIGTDIDTAQISYINKSLPEKITTTNYLKILATGYPKLAVSPGVALFRMTDLRKNLLYRIPDNIEHNFNIDGAGPDVLLFVLTAKSYMNLIMLKEPKVFFRVHDGSFTMVNKDNHVREGYWIALAWFYKNFSNISNWSQWVARTWLSLMIKNRKFISPLRISNKYYGNGSLFEVFFVIISLIKLTIYRLKNKFS